MTTPPEHPPSPDRGLAAPQGQRGEPATATSDQAAFGHPEYGQPQYGQPQYGQPQYGQPQFGQPAYGAPPYGYAGGPGHPYGQPVPKPGTDGFAIAALVLSIIGGVLLSVVFGFVALSRIKRSGRRGRGLAIAGLVISAVWIVVAVGVVVGVVGEVSSGPKRDTTGAVRQPTSVAVTEMKVGDCLTTVPQETGSVSQVDLTPCTNAHRAEVFATFDLTGGSYPGATQVGKLADAGCTARTPTIGASAPGGDLSIYYVFPQPGSWKLGDRTVTCFVATTTPVTSKIVP